jgi:hypothetical protein
MLRIKHWIGEGYNSKITIIKTVSCSSRFTAQGKRRIILTLKRYFGLISEISAVYSTVKTFLGRGCYPIITVFKNHLAVNLLNP